VAVVACCFFARDVAMVSSIKAKPFPALARGQPLPASVGPRRFVLRFHNGRPRTSSSNKRIGARDGGGKHSNAPPLMLAKRHTSSMVSAMENDPISH